MNTLQKNRERFLSVGPEGRQQGNAHILNRSCAGWAVSLAQVQENREMELAQRSYQTPRCTSHSPDTEPTVVPVFAADRDLYEIASLKFNDYRWFYGKIAVANPSRLNSEVGDVRYTLP